MVTLRPRHPAGPVTPTRRPSGRSGLLFVHFLIFVTAVVVMQPARAEVADLSGKWRVSPGVMTIRQTGTRVSGYLTSVTSAGAAYGYRTGDLYMRGSVFGVILGGEYRDHLRRSMWGRCRNDARRWNKLRIERSADGRRLAGWAETFRVRYNRFRPGCRFYDRRRARVVLNRIGRPPAAGPIARSNQRPGQGTTGRREQQPRRATRSATPRPKKKIGALRSCTQCGNALVATISGKIDVIGTRRLRHWLRATRDKYAECIRRIPGGCQHTSIYWKNERALKNCQDNQPPGKPMKVCILSSIY